MSADHDFTMGPAALRKEADNYQHACPTFYTPAGGSRQVCESCGYSEMAHIIAALRTALQRKDESR